MVTVSVSPAEDPDEENSNKGDDYSPQENLSLVEFSSWVVVMISFLNEIRAKGEEKEPNDDTDDEEPEKVEPPTSVMMVVIMCVALIHTFFGQT